MWRHVVSNFLTVTIVALFLAGSGIMLANQAYRAEGPLVASTCVEVPRGARFAALSSQLERDGTISSARLFRIVADYADRQNDLKFGNYLVEAGASMEDVLEVLTDGGPSTCGTEVVYTVGVTRNAARVRELNPQTGRYEEQVRFDITEPKPAAYETAKDGAGTQFRLVVAEGTTVWGVVEAVRANDLLTGEIGEVPEEGAVAPGNYPIAPGDDRQELLARMTAQQERILQAAWGDRSQAGPLLSPEEALILASIVEKETGLAEERRQVASVFVNRLERGMRLQTDPTVIYGITEGKSVLGRGLRRSELRAGTPYNTYIIEGLPPTPIANPGRASIEAVLDPDDTPYIFFVADGTGGHAFAVTLAEHNQNVARWREIEAQRNNN
ncbi:MAG: endolytic transglycosylase MltG [Pseudomonadota bacterium]